MKRGGFMNPDHITENPEDFRHYQTQNLDNPGKRGMMKTRIALDDHFGNKTAQRITNRDSRTFTFPNGDRGNVYVSTYDNLVTPRIQDVDGKLTFIDDPWTPQNAERSYKQSLKFETPEDAEYFGTHYKEVAPMMNVFGGGGIVHKTEYIDEYGNVYDYIPEGKVIKPNSTPTIRQETIPVTRAKSYSIEPGDLQYEGYQQDTPIYDDLRVTERDTESNLKYRRRVQEADDKINKIWKPLSSHVVIPKIVTAGSALYSITGYPTLLPFAVLDGALDTRDLYYKPNAANTFHTANDLGADIVAKALPGKIDDLILGSIRAGDDTLSTIFGDSYDDFLNTVLPNPAQDFFGIGVENRETSSKK